MLKILLEKPGFLFLLGELGGLSEADRFLLELPITIASSASSTVNCE